MAIPDKKLCGDSADQGSRVGDAVAIYLENKFTEQQNYTHHNCHHHLHGWKKYSNFIGTKRNITHPRNCLQWKCGFIRKHLGCMKAREHSLHQKPIGQVGQRGIGVSGNSSPLNTHCRFI